MYCPHCGHQNTVEEIISAESQSEVEDTTQPSFSSESYPLKNKMRMGLAGNTLDIQIEATSPGMAKKLYGMAEGAFLTMVKADLEREWKRNE